MADFALVFDPTTGLCDFAPNAEGTDFLIDEGLTTSVLLSIGLNAQARPDDKLPVTMPQPGASNLLSFDRQGWWGDWYVPGTPERAMGAGQPPADRWGSRDWLLARSKTLPSVVAAAKESWVQALQWMVDSGIAASVTVRAGMRTVGNTSWLVREAVIKRPSGAQVTHRYDTLWANSPIPAPTVGAFFAWDTAGHGFDTPDVEWMT